MMVIPLACAVMRGVFDQAPLGEREAAMALGGTRFGVIRTVVLPFGQGGIIGGTMLALGRALGETAAVLIIISPAYVIKLRILEAGTQTISALIAGNFGNATKSQLSALLDRRLRALPDHPGRQHVAASSSAAAAAAPGRRSDVDHRDPQLRRRGVEPEAVEPPRPRPRARRVGSAAFTARRLASPLGRLARWRSLALVGVLYVHILATSAGCSASSSAGTSPSS